MTQPALSCRASYNNSLRQSLGTPGSRGSKLFFVDKLPMQQLGAVVDFGCADGSLLKALRHVVSPECLLLGVDNDLGQLAAARATFVDGDGFYSSWDFVDPYLTDGRRPSLLILSSVLHEVLSTMELETFWAQVEARGFDYIAIRDMAVPTAYRYRQTPKLWLKLADQRLRAERIAEHEALYGSTLWLDSFVHLLLKYPYESDWKRELEEDYLPHATEELVTLLTSGPYAATHHAATATKHFKDRVMRDFGFCPSAITTHAEIILQHERVCGSVRSVMDPGGNLRVA